MWMRLRNALFVFPAMCTLCICGLAEESALHGSGGRGISKMFLNAHAPDIPPRYSRAEIKRMIRDAKASEDFERLTDYFEYQSLEFEQKANEQVKELERLLALPFHARTYSTQVEHTRDLLKDYKSKANECSARADDYRAYTTAIRHTQ